jgi:hypothetical protein
MKEIDKSSMEQEATGGGSPQVQENPPYNSYLCGVSPIPFLKGGVQRLRKLEILQGGFTYTRKQPKKLREH